MSRKISKSRADRLGDRLRHADPPDPDDLAELQRVIEEYDDPLAHVQRALQEAGFSATSRLKTELTTLEKLKRENNRLSAIHDIAGVRIVLDMNLDEQDDAVERIQGLFETTQVVDRRVNPSSGYRAVHVVAQVHGFPVEIQVRTLFQDLWAQAFERFADHVGRGIRYGEVLDDPALERIRRGLEKASEGIVTIESGERQIPALDRDFESELAAIRPRWFQLALKVELVRVRRKLTRLERSRRTFAVERTALLDSMQELVESLSKGSLQ